MWTNQQTTTSSLLTPEGGYLSLAESQRLKDLNALNLLYTPAEERFDRITRLTARVLQAPIATISFIAGDKQWLKSSVGMPMAEIPRELSFCGHAIEAHHPLIIPDTTQDERFAQNPLVTGNPNVRFYAGQPIHAGARSCVGALCVMDTLPRRPSRAGLDTLRDLAVIVERELTRVMQGSFQESLIKSQDPLARRDSIDGLTQMWKRNVIMDLAHLECAAASRGSPLILLLVDIDHLNQINETYGTQAGDTVLFEVAARLRQSVREVDVIGRYGAGTFLVLLRAGIIDSKLVAERIREAVARHSVPGMDMPITVSIGVAAAKTVSPSPALLISAADKAMRQAKENGRNLVESVLL